MTDQADDLHALFMCIENEGDLYPTLMKMGANAANTPDSEWASVCRTYVARLYRERRYDGPSGAEIIGKFAAQVRDAYVKKARELTVWEHNPDQNPNWTPLMGWRVYACNQCDAEQKLNTNHTGTVWAARCVGKCRTITNPHTAREVVSPYHGPHRYVRDEEA